MPDEFDFEAALSAQVASQTEETPTDEPEEPAVETETEPEPEAEPEAEPEVDPEPEPVFTPEAQKLLDKYGSVEKALEAAAHAQSMIGQQGQELGELRRMVQELQQQTPQAPQPTSPFVPSEMQEAIEENPSQVATWAIQNQNTPLYEAAMRAWYEQDAREASRFEIALEREVLRNELQSQIRPELESVREQQQARAVADAHRELTQTYPDFQQTLETATADEVAGIDRNLLAAAQKENPKAALELVYRWVQAGRSQRRQEETEQRVQAARQEKREAQVVTSETTNPTPEPSAVDRLKEFMLAPEPQSVHHGLTR